VRQIEQVTYDDVALGELAGAVNHPRIDHHERHSRGDRLTRPPVGHRLGALVVVDPDASRELSGRGPLIELTAGPRSVGPRAMKLET